MTIADYVLDERYTLIERIATGGMGEVWRGSDQILGRPVAIKMLAAMHAGDEQFRARFRAEARYASSLAHPGITRVFDYGEQSPLGGPYLVMELIDGQPLSEIIERYGRLDPYVALDIVAQAARALDAAHRAGIVHRDIKPGNLLVMADGTTKITDFGIAKAKVDVSLTATGLVMGTALYVSPEQATGQPLTGSSDVYSLGVVAYECLAGEPPYVAEQPIAIAIMHKHDPIPSLPPDVPRPIADLVYAMLAKNPEERPESARHVADRADIIRDARDGTGRGGPTTSDLPVVPNFPVATSMDLYQGNPERLLDPRRRGNRAFLFAGTGAAAIGAVAIVAVLISGNNGSGVNMGGNVVMPTQSQSQAATHKAAGPRASAAQTVGSNAGVNPGGVMVGATGFAPSSASVGPSKTTRTTPPATHTSAPVHTTPKATIHTTPPTTHTATPPTTHTATPPASSPPASSPPASSPPASSPPASSTAKASGAAG